MILGNNYPQNPVRELTERERLSASILVVDSDNAVRNSVRQALVSLGFHEIFDASDPQNALEKMEDHSFTHVIFDAKGGKISAREFLLSLLEKDASVIALPSSYEPTADDVFSLLIVGAKGFVVKPFTAGSLDEAICWATKGDPITESIRHSRGRNEALAAVIFAALDKLTNVIRQSRKFETAKLEIPRRFAQLRRAVDLARTFSKGGDPQLRQALIDLATERSETSKPQVNITRKKIRRRLSEKMGADTTPSS